MQQFLTLELPHLIISLFVIAVFVFIATRDFMSPTLLRKGLPMVVGFLAFAIVSHYIFTTNRIAEVSAAFENGKTILCSERRSKLGDRSIEVKKGEIWRMEENHFVNIQNEKFSIGQCLIK